MRRTSGSERRAIGRSLVFGGVLLFSASLRAEPDDATKNAARELAERGARAMAENDFAAAEDAYRRAYELVHAPTLSLRHARALSRAGRLVEAVEAYVRTTRFRLESDAPAAFRDAVTEADSELAALRPRVPKLVVVVKGSGAVAEVTIDGKPLAKALIGAAAPIDPGKHEVVVRANGGESRSAVVELGEGEEQRLELELEAASAPAPPAPGAPSPAPPAEPRPGTSEAFNQRSWAWVALGVGVVGAGVGVTTGVMATAKHSNAEDACPAGKCASGSEGADDVESFRRLRTISTIGYVVGALGIGTGVTLWLTAPKTDSGAKVGFFFGPRGAGVSGRY